MGLPDTDLNGEMDLTSLICLGILWCSGSIAEKANSLYMVVKNPSSGDRVSFEPDAWEQLIPKLIYIASVYTYEQVEQFESLRFEYDETLIQLAIPILQNSEDDGLILKIFGEDEDLMLTKHEFINKMESEECRWILDPASIRKKLS